MRRNPVATRPLLRALLVIFAVGAAGMIYGMQHPLDAGNASRQVGGIHGSGGRRVAVTSFVPRSVAMPNSPAADTRVIGRLPASGWETPGEALPAERTARLQPSSVDMDRRHGSGDTVLADDQASLMAADSVACVEEEATYGATIAGAANYYRSCMQSRGWTSAGR